MSKENVEVVQAFMAAANRRDFEAMHRLMSDDLVFHSAFAASEGRVFKGHAGVNDYFDSVEGSFDDLSLPIDDVLDAGGDQVVLLVRVCGRGRASGVAIEQPFGQIWTVGDGLVREIVSYPDPSEALRVAGLTE
jgi:ketosteroid isomerase-like protein